MLPDSPRDTPRPIFFDPEHKRWPRLRLGILLLWLTLSALLGALITSILAAPALPALALPGVSFLTHGAHTVPPIPEPLVRPLPQTPKERALREAENKLQKERERSLRQTLARPPALVLPEQHPLNIGFFVNWDDTSISSLKANLGSLDIVIAEWLHLQDIDGTLRENDPARTAQITQYLRDHRPELAIIPLVNNWSGSNWESAKLGAMLMSAKARAHLVEQLLNYVQQHGYAGISLDFESIPAQAQPGLRNLLAEVFAAFHPVGLQVSINLPVSDPAFNYRQLATNADLVILMAYDQHWSSSAAGPIAGVSWFAKAARERARELPAAKTIIALGGYAYDWGNKGEAAEERSFEEAVLTAQESEGDIHLDPLSLNPTFQYADDADHIHHVWMLDSVTAFNQLQVVRALGVRGVALWRLGSEDPTLWKVLNGFRDGQPLDEKLAAQLADMQFGYDLDYEGQGEILQITAQPHAGLREIGFDPQRRLITREQFKTFPSPYVITRHGAANHKVVLTFDDGPDPLYTPKILDILAAAQVPGVFFVIGANGEMQPDLLRREIAEGHEIGIHTFTHPNIAFISPTQFQLELSASQRLLASVVGRHSLLFRPPYAVDAEPETQDQVRPLEFASQQGYLTVGMQIDPDDWQRPGVDVIINRTVTAAESGDGNIILLHDAGGDRSQTIAALPKLITALRERGFEFISIAQLLGQSRDQLMPLVPADSSWEIWTNWAAFGFINVAVNTMHWLFLLGVLLGIARLALIGILAVYQRFRKRRYFDPDYSPTVAVVVPAYNEEKVIIQTLTSLLACEHPNAFEIIMVDDGSRDGTYALAQTAFNGHPQVRILTQPNSGKAAALNFGLAQTTAEVVVALDADTVFARDTIAKLTRHFIDPHVGAVAGNAKVGNRINLMTRWQALEYITSQNLDRRAFDVLNCITVVPGAVGAWRRQLVLEAGGFTQHTLAEDADLTLSIRRLGYAVIYEDQAIALTEAPDTVRGFIRQRYRWMFGTLQAAWKHRKVLLRPRYGSLGFIALPNVLIFQVLFPLISPIMDLMLLGALGLAAFNHAQHPAQYSPDALERVVFYYALFLAVDFLAAALAFLLEPQENKLLLIWLVWQRFFYRQLMYYVAIKATLASLRGAVVGWGKLERKATVVG